MNFFRRHAPKLTTLASSGSLHDGTDWVHKPHARRRRLALVITTGGIVEIRTPVGVTSQQALNFLNQHRDWVSARLAMSQSSVRDSSCVLFGRRYRLAYADVTTAIDGDVITTRNEASLETFLRAELQRIIESRWPIWLGHIAQWEVVSPTWSLRKMRTRWGSCSASGAIRFSTLLAHHPVDQIDYVIVHELCHLREMNHSAAYWALVQDIMPDWRVRRNRLKHPVNT